MDNLNQDKIKKDQSSPEEQARIRRNFLEELELLREEKENILKKIDLRIRRVVSIDTDDQNKESSLDESLEAFLGELDSAEAEIYKQRGTINQAAINQSSSRLRILKEKARTLLTNTRKD